MVLRMNDNIEFANDLKDTIVMVLLCGISIIVGLRNYLVFHSLVEIFSAVVGFCIMIISMNTYKIFSNSYFAFLGIAFGFVSFFDILHTLAFKGVGVFPDTTGNLATQIWISARYLESISLVLSVWFLRRKLNIWLTSACFLVITVFLLDAIFFWHIFPDCFVAGQGLTVFKKISEVIISILFLVSLIFIIRQRLDFHANVLKLMVGSIILKILAEASFTQYIVVNDVTNMLGHIFKLLSFYFMYKAIVVTSLTTPFKTLFYKTNQALDELKEKSEALRISNNQLKEEIEQREKTENLLKIAKDSADIANRTKSRFLAQMSHEIRTPMNGIIGMTDLALNTDLTSEQREYLGMVKGSANSLLRIINDILDFSKIEAGQLVLESIHYDLYELLSQTLEAFDLSANSKGIGLFKRIESGVPRYVMGDPDRLKQVLVNLIGNAIKFTEQGQVVVTARVVNKDNQKTQGLPKEHDVHFSVADSGIGIPEEKISLLFKSFSQLDNSKAKKHKGSGLGLAISKRIVELMGGSIWVESKDGEGSTFSFTLKLGETEQRQSSTDIEVHPSENQNTCGANPCILLAEDNLVNQKLAVALLKKHGSSVVVVKTGLEAVEAYQAQKFDLILMDVQMPEMDGLEATRTIRKLEKESLGHIPIIALTAYAIKGDREMCLESGMDDYLTKPLKPEELYLIINKWMKHR